MRIEKRKFRDRLCYFLTVFDDNYREIFSLRCYENINFYSFKKNILASDFWFDIFEIENFGFYFKCSPILDLTFKDQKLIYNEIIKRLDYNVNDIPEKVLFEII